MADILGGIGGALGAFLYAWAFPSAIALAALHVVVLRRLQLDLTLGIATMSPAEQALVLAVAATALGLIMSALSTPLYQFLEGYAWPTSLRDRAIRRQRARRQELQRRVDASGPGLDQALARERLQRYPSAISETAPTRFGNAIRAFETYGVDRFHLDSQSFWSELVALAPDSLRKELGTARASVNFFVASTYLSFVVGSAACLTAVIAAGGFDVGIFAVGLVALMLVPVAYRSAVTSSTYWDSTVRALVNLGRKPLAVALDLRIPATIEQERQMWETVSAFHYYDFDQEWASALDGYRASNPDGPRSDDELPAAEQDSKAITGDET